MKRGDFSLSVGILYPLYRHFVDIIAGKICAYSLVKPIRLEHVD